MTLAPLLQGARDWCPPADVAEKYGYTHFAARCIDRGVRSIPGHLLLWVVREALDAARTDLVEPVYSICLQSTLYRIWLPDGLFYPVVRDGSPVTIYSAAEKSKLQRTRRKRKRHTGARVRKVSVH